MGAVREAALGTSGLEGGTIRKIRWASAVRLRGGDVTPRWLVVSSFRDPRRDLIAERAAPAVSVEVALQAAVGQRAQKRGSREKGRY